MKDMPSLVIVESPTKAKTLSRYLGTEYRIEATMGHIRDLPEKKLGIEIKPASIRGDESTRGGQTTKYKFIPDYQSIPSRKEKISELKKLADGAEVILATDPDREGEAIAYHIGQVLGKKSALKRIVFHEITESAIKHALASPRELDMQLVDAQQARRILDRLVGYKLSPVLWNKLGKRWLSAGRVQSVAVRLIVEREREILAFKAVEYWVIDVQLQKTQNETGENIIARLEKINSKKAEVVNKEQADKIVDDLKQFPYKISNIEVKESRRYPTPPFTTSTLQQAAANRFGWTAKRTMRTAQNLYEEGHISYHRTDSTNLSSEAIKMVRDYIYNVYGKNYLPQAPKFYKTKSKVAQEAHEAIRPTVIQEITNYKLQITNKLGRDPGMLYDLIWKKFVACQMNEAVVEQTNVEILAKSIKSESVGEVSTNVESEDSKTYLLKSQGERMKFDGWIVLYGEKLEKELPPLVQGEDLNFINILPQQKFTEPPARYTEATIIKALEEKGIGRPSTYAPIISTIQDRKYVEKIERKFKPTDLGFAVNDFLIKYFPDVFDIGFTARMEDELDEIANGKMEWNDVIGDFYAPFKLKIDDVMKVADRVKVDLGTTDEKCPECGSVLVYRLSKFGKFLACSNYPTCKFTKNVIEKAGIPCPRCKGDIVVKKTRRGKQFYGCSNYPQCTFAAWKKEDIK
ncbi:type I DNA topoisomerase [Candidatus Gottesmanbacteria bacterium]|nr:type I DNA topoisomerase [Candidatus Gottesmanbacteria bacterium]